MNLEATSIRTHELLEQIRGSITSGELKPGQRLPSLRDLSRRFGTSVTLVQRCFRQLEADGLVIQKQGSGTFVNPDLKFSGSKLIGLITSYKRDDIENYYEPLFDIAARRRVVPMVGVVNFQTEWKQTIKDIMMINPHGLLIDVAAKGFDLDELMSLVGKTPVCFCNRWEWYPEQPEGCAVLLDHVKMRTEALQWLINSGHERIAIGLHDNPPAPYLEKYMQKAFARFKARPGLRLIHVYSDDIEKNASGINKKLKDAGVTAMFAGSDNIISSFRKYCPAVADMELVGVFNQHHSRQQGHEFSSFDPCFEQIWEKAFDLLEHNSKEVVYIKPELIMRSHRVLQEI
jgi:DNA-binding transcriptional regulator YhcF (GntR family)